MKKIITLVLALLTGVGIGACIFIKIGNREKQKIRSMSNKHLELFLMMNQWVRVKQDGKSIVSYLYEKGYKNIAVYGMSYAGECLLYELKNSNIIVQYGIDKKANELYSAVEVLSPDDDLKNVDVVIVTSISFFDEVKENLSQKLSCPIISLEDILYEL